MVGPCLRVVVPGVVDGVVEAGEARRHHSYEPPVQSHAVSLPPSPSSSPARFSFPISNRGPRACALLSAMRIRKGSRFVSPLVSTDHACLQMKEFAHGEGNARCESDEEKPVREFNQVSGVAALRAAAPAAASHGESRDLALGNGMSSAITERLDDDRVRKRLSAHGRSRKRSLIANGVISITSIIQAGVKSAPRRNSTSAPASRESVIISVASPAKSPANYSPSIAEKTIDQSNLLLQSLKKVCSAAENTGLTAKEAVGKILDQGLPGLIEGGERLIVQVAKLFRNSSVFVEREERGRYFIRESFQQLTGWGNFLTGDGSMKLEKAVLNGAATETEKAIEAATQLAKLQSIELESVDKKVGFPEHAGKPVRTGRWVLALSCVSGSKRSTSEETNALWDPETGVLRCNRDDGKGWRCPRIAESGFSLCKYHREQIRRAEIRRRKTRSKSKKRRTPPTLSSLVSAPVQSEKPSNPTFDADVKAISAPGAGNMTGGITGDANSIESNNELPDHKRRRVVKAKSLKSL